MSTDRDFEDELATAYDRVPDDAKPHCDALHALAKEMADEISSLRDELGDAEDRADEADRESALGIVEDWMTDLRYAVVRPVGKLQFHITNQPAFDRAMLRLFDKAGINVLGN